jgi:mono/diheme cytochrome c family protein
VVTVPLSTHLAFEPQPPPASRRTTAPRQQALRLTAAALLALSLPAPGTAHELITTRLTWTEQISRIFHHHCVSCHREGGQAPLPLTSYEQVRPWAKAIKYAILSRSMPPWDAVKGYGAFQNDLSLSQDDIAKISSWVEGGAPEGNAAFLPVVPAEQSLGEPGPPEANARPLPGALILEKDVTALGIQPENVPESGSLQVTAYRPDGSVEPLIWLRGYRRQWRRAYWFREPLALPKGTRILLFPPADVSATLLVAK